MKKRRFFSLLEVIITLSLFSVLLTTLFVWYRDLNLRKIELKKLAQKHGERNALGEKLKVLKRVSPFYFCYDEKEGGLLFSFDNGVDREPLLSHFVLARLFVDKRSDTLCLKIKPLPEKKVTNLSKTYVLAEGISDLSCRFYYPKELGVAPQKVGEVPQIGWQERWSKNYETLPALIEVTLSLNKESIRYLFEVYASPNFIVKVG